MLQKYKKTKKTLFLCRIFPAEEKFFPLKTKEFG